VLHWDESHAGPLPAPPVLQRGFTLLEPEIADGADLAIGIGQLQPAFQAGAAQLAHDLRALIRPVRGLVRLIWQAARAAAAEGRVLVQEAVREGSVVLGADSQALLAAGREGADAARRFLARAASLRQAWPRWSARLREAARIGGAELLAEAQPLVEAVRPHLARTPLPGLWRRTGLAVHVLGRRASAAAQWAWTRTTPQRLAAHAALRAARWRVSVVALRQDERRLLRSLVAADAALAGAIALVLLLAGPVFFASSSVSAAHPAWQARAALVAAQSAGLSAPPTAVPATATPAPTPTPAPVLTATPIPIIFTTWESSLPIQGGWNGLGECWGTTVLAPVGSGLFNWPTDKRFLVGKNYNVWSHPGLDLGGDIGDPLYAADGGVVVYAGWNVWGFGNLVIIDHGNGWHTLYAHMSQINVTCGQGVTAGTILGLAGSTGRSTGPHLHFEMRYNGGNVNPWDYLP